MPARAGDQAAHLKQDTAGGAVDIRGVTRSMATRDDAVPMTGCVHRQADTVAAAA